MTMTNKCTQDAIVIAGNHLLEPTFFIIIRFFNYGQHSMGAGEKGKVTILSSSRKLPLFPINKSFFS